MAVASDNLWWTSHGAIHSLLQNSSFSLRDVVQKQLDGHFDWLLHNLQNFKQQTDASAKLLDQTSIVLRGKKFAIEAKLKTATLKTSVLLDLDEIQAHILLKRWLKDTEQDGLLQDPSLPAGQEIQFGQEVLLQVMTYYHQERLFLLKCAQYILLQSMAGQPMPVFSEVAGKLMSGDLEGRMFSSLRSNFEAGLQQGAGGAAGGAGAAGGVGSGVAHAAAAAAAMAQGAGTIAGRMAAVMKEFGTQNNAAWISAVHTAMREQLLQERCELLGTLLLIYETPISQSISGSRNTKHCSNHRLLELVRMLGSSLFPAAPPCVEDANGELVAWQAPVPSKSDKENGDSLAVSEYLASLLVLSALDLPEYVTITAASSTSTVTTPDALPLGGKMQDVHNELRSWAGTVTNAGLLLTWSAVVKLTESYSDLDESASEELMGRASQAGGFGAMAACLKYQGTLISSAFASVCRGVVMKALCVIGTAYDVGMRMLDSGTYEQLVDLLKQLLEGDSQTCAALWGLGSDPNQILYASVRSLLKDACTVFPAVAGPYVQLLTIFSEGTAAASAAYAHLQVAPKIVSIHRCDDGMLLPQSSQSLHGNKLEAGMAVVLNSSVAWTQAPSVRTLVLPAGVEGIVLHMPTALSHLSSSGLALIEWDVQVGVESSESNFGQFLMLGRAAHCLHELQNSLHHHAQPDPVALQDLLDSIGLILHFVQQMPFVVPELMLLSVDMAESGAKRDWMDIALGAAAILPRLPPNQNSASSSAVPFKLLTILSQHHPHRVLAAIQHLPLLYTAAAPQEQKLPTLLLRSILEDRQFPDPGMCLGLLPALKAFQQNVEGKLGRYPMTRAFLELVASFLGRGYVTGPISTFVLYCLHELLPQCHTWHYVSADERWLLVALAFKVLRLSIEAGAHVVETPNSPTGDTSFQPAASLVHVTGLGCHVIRQLLLQTSSILATSLPPPVEALDSLRQADPSSSGVAAVEMAVAQFMRLLPLATCASEPCRNDLPLEDFLFNSPSPGYGMPPAELLGAYITYHQPENEQVEEDTITYLALKAVQAMQGLVSRPLTRPLPCFSMSALVPRGSQTEAALKEFFRPNTARNSPKHFLLAVEILETAAVQDHAELLDCLSLPSGLQPQLKEPAEAEQSQAPSALPAAAAAASTTPASTAPGSTTTALTTTGAAGDGKTKTGSKKKPSAEVWSVLDGLYSLLKQTPELKKEQPDVLCHALRAVCALWQNQAVASLPVYLLRSKGKEFFALLETCLSPVASDNSRSNSNSRFDSGSDSASPAGAHWVQLAQAYVWQVLMLEAFVCPRPAAPSPADRNPVEAELWLLLDRLALAGTLNDAILVSSHLPISRHTLHQLMLLTQVTYLELGASALSGIFSGCGGMTIPEDLVPFAQDMKGEMEELSQLLIHNGAATTDLEAAHARLLKRLHTVRAAGRSELAGSGVPPSPSPASPPTGAMDEEEDDEEEWEREEGAFSGGVDLFVAGELGAGQGDVGNRIVSLLTSRPLGRTLLCHSQPPVGLTLESVTYGPAFLYDGNRMLKLLGPAVTSHIAHASRLAQCMGTLSSATSLSIARMTTLKAACGLAAVLPKNQPASSSPETSAKLCNVAVQAATCCVSDLLAFASSSEIVWRALQQPVGLGPLPQNLVEAALVTCKFVLHSLTMLKGGRTDKAASSSPPPPSFPLTGGMFGASAPRAASSRGGASTSGTGSSSSAMLSTTVSAVCLKLVTLLSAWLRSVSKGCVQLGSRVSPDAVVTITDYLASSVMVVLQLSHSSTVAAASSLAEADHRPVQAVLLDALPQLCKMCRSGAVSLSVGSQLLVEVVQRHLPASDWLPVVREHVDIMAMLSEAATHMKAQVKAASLGPSTDQDLYAAGDLGVLQLALAVAQVPEGAYMLLDLGVLQRLAALGRHMCVVDGGALAPFNSLELSMTGDGSTPAFRPSISVPSYQDAGMGTRHPPPAVDVSAAYLGGAWSPVHKQWVVLLSFTSVILRMLGQHMDVENDAVDFIVSCEPRLLLSLLPPEANTMQPLTLAGLLEAERALFLLTHCAQRFSGTWQLMLPSSLQRFRIAASSLIAFIAQPPNSRSDAVTLQCGPQSVEERRLLGVNSGMSKSEGWFRICAKGSEIVRSGNIEASLQPLLLTSGAGSSSATWATSMCSEYAAKVAESVYASLHHALTFLLATSPQISEGEANNLGPMWPKVRDLVILQEQAKAVLASIGADVQPSGSKEVERQKRLCQLLMKVGLLISQFLEALGYSAPPATANTGGRRSTTSSGGNMHYGGSSFQTSSYMDRGGGSSMDISHARRAESLTPPLFSLSGAKSMSTSIAG